VHLALKFLKSDKKGRIVLLISDLLKNVQKLDKKVLSKKIEEK
jgi:hypothetical protein